MFPKHHHFRVFAFLMSLLLATLMTGIITFINTGLDTGFTSRWGHALVIAWPIAFLIVLTIGPSVRSLADRLCTRA